MHCCETNKLVFQDIDLVQVTHIATILLTVEQSNEWFSPLYANFIDHEKSRKAFWNLLGHYGVTSKHYSKLV